MLYYGPVCMLYYGPACLLRYGPDGQPVADNRAGAVSEGGNSLDFIAQTAPPQGA